MHLHPCRRALNNERGVQLVDGQVLPCITKVLSREICPIEDSKDGVAVGFPSVLGKSRYL
jgi:hypothetical protein